MNVRGEDRSVYSGVPIPGGNDNDNTTPEQGWLVATQPDTAMDRRKHCPEADRLPDGHGSASELAPTAAPRRGRPTTQ